MSTWVLVAVCTCLVGCVGLVFFAPRYSVREVVFATMALAGALAIPITAALAHLQ